MKQHTTIAMILTLGLLIATTAMSTDHLYVDIGVFPVGQPILLADDSGDRLYTVTGRLDNAHWGFAFYTSADGGTSWTKTYDEVWSEEFTEVDATWHDDSVYVAQIDSWTSGASQYWDLNIQRFNEAGQRDPSFGGSGMISVNNPATEVTDVSLVAKNGYLEIFWIGDGELHHSYLSISGGGGQVTHSDIGTVYAYKPLDAVAVSGQNAHFFAAFRNITGRVVGWKWKFGVGSAVVDITPDESLYTEHEDITASSSGRRIDVVVGSPYDSNPTRVHSMSSNDDGLTWSQDVLALGWDGVGIHVWTPTIATGPDQSVATIMIKDDNTNVAEWGFLQRNTDESWSPSPRVFTPDTDFIGTPMGLCWSPEGGFMAVYYSNHPQASSVVFTRMPQLMRDGFESGDFDSWSRVVGQ